MKKVIATIMAAGLVAQVASAVSAGVDISSAYVFRGETFNDGTVVQPGMEGEVMGVTVGTWANIDINDAGNNDPLSEVNFYLGYGLGEIAGFSIDAGFCEYAYPGAGVVESGGEANGESELSVSISGVVSGFDVSAAAYADVEEEASPGYYEFSIGGGYDLTSDIAASYGVTAGYFDEDAESGFGYSAISFGVEKPVSDVLTAGISLTLIEGMDDALVTVTEDQVVTFSIGGDF